jgi:hypothetical protein
MIKLQNILNGTPLVSVMKVKIELNLILMEKDLFDSYFIVGVKVKE